MAIMRNFTPSRIQKAFIGIPHIVLPTFQTIPPSFSGVRLPKLRANDASGAIEEPKGEFYVSRIPLSSDNSGASDGPLNSRGLTGSNVDSDRT